MAKNVVVCLDGTNNQVRAAANTNVVRLYRLLDLSDPTRQVAYYQPGVGTFGAPGTWTPLARNLTRLMGSAFGLGLRKNLGDAYAYLMSVCEPDDDIYVFGFSRGAYTARALTGMLEVMGLFRPGAENLVPYAVSAYARNADRHKWAELREYSEIFSDPVHHRRSHVPVRFLGVWDTVKAAGNIGPKLNWPYTRQQPHVQTVRHAVAIDERRRPYADYLVEPTKPEHLPPPSHDIEQVWFAGVHSDVGGMFETGARLSDIPYKWMAQQAVGHGLLVDERRYRTAQTEVDESLSTAAIHRMGGAWALLGTRRRVLPPGSLVHASVEERVAADPSYARHLPADRVSVDPGWLTPE